MPRRPEFSASSAILSPAPSHEISRSALTRASSRCSWATTEPVRPMVRSGLAADRPGVAPSTSRQLMCSLGSSEVRAIIV
jgi:hypothetical protein